MTRDELLERIFWAVNDWEFDVADHDDMGKIMRLVDEYADEVQQEAYDRGVDDGPSIHE